MRHSIHPSAVEQYFSTNNIQVLANSGALGWGNTSMRIVWSDLIQDFRPNPKLENDVLIFKLKGTARQQMRLADGVVRNNQIAPGTLLLFPRYLKTEVRFDTAHTYAALELDRSMFNDLAVAVSRGDPAKIEMRPELCFNDPLLYYLGIELCNEVQNGSPLGTLFADSVLSTLMLYLLRKYSSTRITREVANGRLTTEQFRKINEYIHEHLDQKITLADLANCLYLSVPHFERMFRLTMCCAPYQYVMECRLEQARLLLHYTRTTLYEVARLCGFANQSHFTKHFTRHTGVSPARYSTIGRNAG